MPQHNDGAAHRHSADALSRAVAGYCAEQFLFASPRSTLLTRGVARRVSQGPEALRERIAQAFDAADTAGDQTRSAETKPLLIGAVPFDTTHPAQLAVTCEYLQGGPVHGHLPEVSKPCAPLLQAQTTPWPAPQDFETSVEQALGQLRQGPLSKVVLARTLRLQFDRDLDVSALLTTLLRKHPQAYTYAVPVTRAQDQDASVFVGATPELLVRREGMRVFLNPLAGSAARRHDPSEDDAVAQALMRSDKDLREHAVVIDAIAQVLRPLCKTLHVPEAPSLISTDALWHLSTVIEGELIDPSLTSLDLALALHPTPAVCGHPLSVARAAIAGLEPFDRSLFAGFVGWVDAAGDGEWAVALRCADCATRSATLYAGAGIVAGSNPQAERLETQTKFRTMLSAMGVDQAIAAP